MVPLDNMGAPSFPLSLELPSSPFPFGAPPFSQGRGVQPTPIPPPPLFSNNTHRPSSIPPAFFFQHGPLLTIGRLYAGFPKKLAKGRFLSPVFCISFSWSFLSNPSPIHPFPLPQCATAIPACIPTQRDASWHKVAGTSSGCLPDAGSLLFIFSSFLGNANASGKDHLGDLARNRDRCDFPKIIPASPDSLPPRCVFPFSCFFFSLSCAKLSLPRKAQDNAVILSTALGRFILSTDLRPPRFLPCTCCLLPSLPHDALASCGDTGRNALFAQCPPAAACFDCSPFFSPRSPFFP